MSINYVDYFRQPIGTAVLAHLPPSVRELVSVAFGPYEGSAYRRARITIKRSGFEIYFMLVRDENGVLFTEIPEDIKLKIIALA
jgi:hypothetical protein